MIPSEGLRGLYAREPARDAPEARTLKVKVPVRHVLLLRRCQLYDGRTFSSVVAEALERYFERLEAESRAERAS